MIYFDSIYPSADFHLNLLSFIIISPTMPFIPDILLLLYFSQVRLNKKSNAS